MRFTKFVSVIALSSIAAGAANATPITSAFDTALSGGTVITFDNLSNETVPTLVQGDVTISGGGPIRVESTYAGQYNTRGTAALDNNGGATNLLTFTFATPVSAFGFLWGAADDVWVLNAYDSSNTLIESYNVPTTHASNAGDFFGLSDPGIVYATLSDISGNDYVFVDNFTYVAGADQSVPEPASMALLGAGLFGMGMIRRRKQG